MTSKVIVKAMLVGPDGRVLVLRREPNDPDHPGRMDFPGGSAELGESYVAAIAREIQEETGLEVPEQQLDLAYAFTVVKDDQPDVARTRLLFLARVADTAVRLSDEHDAYWWRTLAEVREAFTDTSWQVPVEFVLTHDLITAS